MRSYAKERWGQKKQMVFKTMAARTLFAAAALSALAASANAFVLGIDPQIFINRTIDSPTLTVRYTDAMAALVELRINGASFGTRTVSNPEESGETNFTISQGDLHSGDNDVEIRLFDRTGKLIAKDHTNISVAEAPTGPVFLSSPKTGDTVRGPNPVEIKLGFDKELKDCYVSFFVDGSFKKMTNVPPFVYDWDTQRETNGWHELEAWAIDDTSETHKTTKIKVFVNNPGGDTRRFAKGTNELAPSKNVGTDELTGKDRLHIKKVIGKTKPMIGEIHALPPTAPSLSPEAVLGPPASTKPIKTGNSIAMGPQNMLPIGRTAKHPGPQNMHPKGLTAKHPGEVISITVHKDHDVVAMNTHRQVGRIASNVTNAANLIKISKGSRLPNLAGAFEIALDSEFVDFHGVLPRVDSGVPMTPLRFLIEKKGGLVDWDNPTKTVFAKADGNDLSLQIGNIFAMVNRGNVKMERPSYLDRGRTVVSLSFMETALHVKIDYDKSTNHMLITSKP